MSPERTCSVVWIVEAWDGPSDTWLDSAWTEEQGAIERSNEINTSDSQTAHFYEFVLNTAAGFDVARISRTLRQSGLDDAADRLSGK